MRVPLWLSFRAAAALLLVLLLTDSHFTVSTAFTTQQSCSRQSQHLSRIESSPTILQVYPPSKQRRLILRGGLVGIYTLIPTSESARAVVISSNAEGGKVFQTDKVMTTSEALERFQRAQKDLRYLIDHYDEIVASGGGDNVRRYLGTVGFTSALYGMPKVLKQLQEEANDVVEYTENMNDFDAALRAADTACYSANFVEFSAAKTKPEKFFQDALADIKNMRQYLNNMAIELNLTKL